MKKAGTIAGFIFSVLLVGVWAFYGGYYMGKRGFEIEIKKNPPKIDITNKEPQDQTVDFQIFWDTWKSLNEKHIDRPLDAKKLVYGAAQGMVAAVGDDYTAFFPPVQNKMAKSSLNGTYEGIGAELGFKEKQIVIIAPIEGSPAEAAGVKAGDAILEIDGNTTAGITIPDAVSKIRGDSGTAVTLKLFREGQDPFDLKITRGQIKTKSVTWKDLGDGVGYLRLARFGDSTSTEWTESVLAMKTEMPNLKAVVLDVRGNPGGYLTAAQYIASEFLPSGKTVLYEELADKTLIQMDVNRLGAWCIFVFVCDEKFNGNCIMVIPFSYINLSSHKKIQR
jgi:carboxyl-terminal processing protease